MTWFGKNAPKVRPRPAFPNDRLLKALDAVQVTGGTFDMAVGFARERRKIGAKVYFVGNGGSAAIASHMAADWMKAGKFASLCFNDGALVTCLANDLGYGSGFSEPIKRFGQPEDLLFAISSSGQSINILNAANAAKNIGMRVVTLSGFSPLNPLREMGDINFYVNSTRYGPVEITHLSILHAMLDQLIESET